MTKQSYPERLTIPLTGGVCEFRTLSGCLIAKSYQRIVIGDRGPYVEFSDSDLILSELYIPEDQRYRLGNDKVFYDEWRTKDVSNVKVYNQKNTVDYADYRIGKWYINPASLLVSGQIILLPLVKGAGPKEEVKLPEKGLFDLI